MAERDQGSIPERTTRECGKGRNTTVKELDELMVEWLIGMILVENGEIFDESFLMLTGLVSKHPF